MSDSSVAAAELSSHTMVSEALDRGVRNRNWFIWLSVDGTPRASEVDDLVTEVESWLAELDLSPDHSNPPDLVWDRPAVHLRVRALAKKPHARGAEPLVANPYPAFAYWT